VEDLVYPAIDQLAQVAKMSIFSVAAQRHVGGWSRHV
jgi:hypothetical protein